MYNTILLYDVCDVLLSLVFAFGLIKKYALYGIIEQ